MDDMLCHLVNLFFHLVQVIFNAKIFSTHKYYLIATLLQAFSISDSGFKSSSLTIPSVKLKNQINYVCSQPCYILKKIFRQISFLRSQSTTICVLRFFFIFKIKKIKNKKLKVFFSGVSFDSIERKKKAFEGVKKEN